MKRDAAELWTYALMAVNVVITATAIAVGYHLWRKARRWHHERCQRERGLCMECGYDLRGTCTDGGQCPECGTWNLSAASYGPGRGDGD